MKNSDPNEKEIKDWKWASKWNGYTVVKDGKEILVKEEDHPPEVRLYRKLKRQVNDILYKYKRLRSKDFTRQELINDIKKAEEIMKPLDLENDFADRYIQQFLM